MDSPITSRLHNYGNCIEDSLNMDDLHDAIECLFNAMKTPVRNSEAPESMINMEHRMRL